MSIALVLPELLPQSITFCMGRHSARICCRQWMQMNDARAQEFSRGGDTGLC